MINTCWYITEADAKPMQVQRFNLELKDLAVGLNQTVDYGWLLPIAKLLFFRSTIFP